VTGALQTIVQRSSRYRADAAASRNDPHRAAGTNITAPTVDRSIMRPPITDRQ